MRGFEERYVKDHAEWLRLAERADDGVYAMHGFVASNAAAPPSSPRRLITDKRVVEKAVEQLGKEFGWGALAGVSGPMTTDVSVFEVLSIGEPRYVGDETLPVEGGWWLVLPVGYHRHLHDPGRCEFRVRACGRDVTLYAREFDERRAGKTSLPEFGYTVEYALVGNDVCIYNDHPDAAEATTCPPHAGRGIHQSALPAAVVTLGETRKPPHATLAFLGRAWCGLDGAASLTQTSP